MAFLTGQNPKLCDLGHGSVGPWASGLCLWIVRIEQPELNSSASCSALSFDEVQLYCLVFWAVSVA